MTAVERIAADDTPSGPHMRPSVTTAERCEVPAGWPGKAAWFQAVAGSGAAVDVVVRFGGASVDVDPASASTRTVEALSANATAPDLHLVASAPRVRVRIPATATHFAHVSSATTGRLRFGLATGTG